MRELDVPDPHTSLSGRVAVVGAGRMGTALADGLRAAGVLVSGPLGRDAEANDASVVLLAVTDSEIAAAAAAIRPGRLVGHCSGATALSVLGPHEGFSVHPLIAVAPGAPVGFAGAACAVAGTSERGLATARAVAAALGMTGIEVADADRAAYHAAASVASNFLIALQAAAERLAASAGVERPALVPLVRASVENWATLGPARALTGPIARGDEDVVAAQRAAVAGRTPELLALFDALADFTRVLARDGDRARPPRPAPETTS